MASPSLFAPPDEIDLSAIPSSADTIHVSGGYMVAAGDTLDLQGGPGIKLKVKSHSDQTGFGAFVL